MKIRQRRSLPPLIEDYSAGKRKISLGAHGILLKYGPRNGVLKPDKKTGF